MRALDQSLRLLGRLLGRILGALLAALCLAACAPAAKPRPALSPEATKEAEFQRDFAVQSLYERQDRLNALGYTMITANEPLCRQRGRVRKSLGLTADYFNTRDSKEWLPTLSKMWGVGENTIVVTGVVPGSPAAKAGVLRGDVIQVVSGRVYDLASKRVNVTQNMDELSAKGPVTLKLLRAGKTVPVTIPAPVDVCESRFVVRIGDAVNAYADGKNVIVTYGIMNLYSKDEDLAVVLGHELAHNILGHARKDGSGKSVPSTPEKETEADAVGLYFTARAGFSIENAPNVWRRMAAQNPAHIKGSLVHPSSASRFVDMETVKNEIMQRQAAGLPLIPRPRVVPGQ